MVGERGLAQVFSTRGFQRRRRVCWRPRGRGRRRAALRPSGSRLRPPAARLCRGAGGAARGGWAPSRAFAAPLLPGAPSRRWSPSPAPVCPPPGGPGAWSRPTGKLSRDRCARAHPAASRASGAAAAAPASRDAIRVRRPEARAGGPGFSAAVSPDGIDHLELCVYASCKMGRGIMFQVPFTFDFLKLHHACTKHQMEPCFQDAGLTWAPRLSPGKSVLGS